MPGGGAFGSVLAHGVAPPAPPPGTCVGTAVTYDNFTRSESGTWGTASGGGAWTTPFGIPTGGSLAVSGGAGIIDLADAALDNGLVVQNTAGPWLNPGGFLMEAQISWSHLLPASGQGTDDIYFIVVGNKSVGLRLNSADGEFELVDGALIASVPKTDWAMFTFYRVKWQYLPGVGSKAKVWKQADPEPDWMLSIGDGGAVAGGTPFQIDCEHNGISGEIFETAFYEVWLTECNA